MRGHEEEALVALLPDLKHSQRFARQGHVGRASVDDWPANDRPNDPHGGRKNDGLGRDNAAKSRRRL
jgi:acyl-CoA reductase-like NAD-dependent aldehyde dehydrogenase